MDNIKTELKIYEFALTELEKLQITPIWALTYHIGCLKHTIETREKQDSCPHTQTEVEELPMRGLPRFREYCTTCNKTIKEW